MVRFVAPCETGLSTYLKLVPDFVCPFWNGAGSMNIIISNNPSPTTFKY